MRTLFSLLTCSTLALAFLPSTPSLTASQLPTDISLKAKPATIKVLLARRANSILLEAKGRHQIYNPTDGLEIASGVSSKLAVLTPDERGVKWGDLYPGIFQMRIVPGDSQSSILVDGIQYKGCVEIYVIDGKVNVVNEIDIENYLKSTLTAKFPNKLNEEVMNAIAIVERTNTYYTVGKHPHIFWHVDAAEVGYQGYALIFQNLHVDKAIESTRYTVMTYKNSPFAAAWTKDSAGKTASFSTIFRKNVNTPAGVETPIASQERDKRCWSFVASKEQIARLAKVKDVTAIDLYIDSQSNKVYGVKISDESESQDIDFLTLQKALGAAKLLSNDFTIALKGDSILFTGHGEGLGVGLCLYSAKALAERGENAQQILSAFFPETSLENLRSFPKAQDPVADRIKTFKAKH